MYTSYLNQTSDRMDVYRNNRDREIAQRYLTAASRDKLNLYSPILEIEQLEEVELPVVLKPEISKGWTFSPLAETVVETTPVVNLPVVNLPASTTPSSSNEKADLKFYNTLPVAGNLDLSVKDKKITYDFTSIGKKYDKLNDLMKTLIRLFEEEGVPVRITSGWRYAGLVGKAGNRSHHVHGGAIDVVPAHGATFEDISRAMTTNPRIRTYMLLNKLGYIDETSAAALKRTGGTGKHFHIGPDLWALRDYSKALTKYNISYSKNGGIIGYLDYIR